jgi:hypothetical protein
MLRPHVRPDMHIRPQAPATSQLEPELTHDPSETPPPSARRIPPEPS